MTVHCGPLSPIKRTSDGGLVEDETAPDRRYGRLPETARPSSSPRLPPNIHNQQKYAFESHEHVLLFFSLTRRYYARKQLALRFGDLRLRFDWPRYPVL